MTIFWLTAAAGWMWFGAVTIWCLAGVGRELPSGWWVTPGLMAGAGMLLAVLT